MFEAFYDTRLLSICRVAILTTALLLTASDSAFGQTPATNGASETINRPSTKAPAPSPCSMGAEDLLKRQFDAAQPLLWLCVLSDERQPQDAGKPHLYLPSLTQLCRRTGEGSCGN